MLHALFLATFLIGQTSERLVTDDPRPPRSETELRRWLTWAAAYYGFTPREIGAALGLSEDEVNQRLRELGLEGKRASLQRGELLVLPYPGGRHPRAGFFEGAIRPRRETKVGVFPPWPKGGFVVVDVPEAIWEGRELIYLAHTHIPTRWDREGKIVPRTDWEVRPDKSLVLTQPLPDGTSFHVQVRENGGVVRMRIEIRNGSRRAMRDLRAQVCVMLAEARGFSAQTSDNKRQLGEFAVVAGEGGAAQRHILTSWRPLWRVWNNPRVPCVHADPRFPDCGPGQVVSAQGVLAFVEGEVREPLLMRLRKLVSASQPGEAAP